MDLWLPSARFLLVSSCRIWFKFFLPAPLEGDPISAFTRLLVEAGERGGRFCFWFFFFFLTLHQSSRLFDALLSSLSSNRASCAGSVFLMRRWILASRPIGAEESPPKPLVSPRGARVSSRGGHLAWLSLTRSGETFSWLISSVAPNRVTSSAAGVG